MFSRPKSSRPVPIAGFIIAVATAVLGSSELASPQTVSWKGFDWGDTFPSNTISVNADGTLSVFTGITPFGIVGGATHQTPLALQTASEAWAEATFFDTDSAPGPQIFLIHFESTGSAYAALGAFGNQRQYSAHWRRDSADPATAVLGTTINVGPRSAGLHTARIGKRADGRLEFWLDGMLVLVSGADAFPATFNFISLIGSAGLAPGQIATFTDYAEGTGPAAVAPPTVTPFTDRLSWQASSAALTSIGFEGLAAPGGFVPYDNAAGLSVSSVNFTGLTPITGPNGPARYYLSVVDPAYSPPFYDWGSGAVLRGPPIPVGPQGEVGPNSRIRVMLAAGATSVGVDLMSFLEYASPFRVVVSTRQGSVEFPASSFSHPTRSFLGFTSDSPIISLDYYALNGFPVLDNFAFGTSAIAPACALSLSPRALAFGAQGGLGSFGVITAAACTWSATSNASWITLLPGGSCNKVGDVVLCPLGTRKVNFVVATNTGAARSASISVGDQQFQVTQQAPACTFSIQPSHGAFSDTGGNLGVNVYTLPPGMICSWTATSSVPWLTVASGGSGSGTGRIILRAEPNTSGPRTGAATIAGQTFSVTQGGGVCGAHDVTNQVTVFSSGLNWVPGTTYTYVGNYTVSNRPLFPPVEGSLFLVLVGLPKIAPYPDSAGLATATALTYCFSSRGDYILPLGTSLQSGQLVRFNLTIVSQRPDGFLPYSLKFLSGAPNR